LTADAALQAEPRATTPERFGHVFVVPGDLTRIHCHAWLVPTDTDFDIAEHWRRRGDTTVILDEEVDRLKRLGWQGQDVVRYPTHGSDPHIWLGNVATTGGTVDQPLKCVRHS
jgi:hypothetical protein